MLFAVLVLGCPGRTERNETVAESRSIEQVLAAHNDSLMSLPGVVGTAIGVCDGAPCIRVFLADTSAAARVPARLEGYTVKAEVTGRFRPL